MAFRAELSPIPSNTFIAELGPNPGIIEGRFMYDGHQYPRFVNIPEHLIDASELLGNERADFTEKRMENIIASQKPVVKKVIRNVWNGDADANGYDLSFQLQDGYPVTEAHVQVKAGRHDIVEYKHWIRNRLFSKDFKNEYVGIWPEQVTPGLWKGLPEGDKEEIIRRWLTEHKIILINGAETKSFTEILRDSFYPQLQRILKKSMAAKQAYQMAA